MKAIRLRQPAGLDNLKFEDMAGPSAPGRGEIKVRLRASSLNYHDYLVAVGGIPTPDGRIPMSDGAGEVLAVGEGVTNFAVGDAVVSTFFPNWLDGRPIPGGFAGVPGEVQTAMRARKWSPPRPPTPWHGSRMGWPTIWSAPCVWPRPRRSRWCRR